LKPWNVECPLFISYRFPLESLVEVQQRNLDLVKKAAVRIRNRAREGSSLSVSASTQCQEEKGKPSRTRQLLPENRPDSVRHLQSLGAMNAPIQGSCTTACQKCAKEYHAGKRVVCVSTTAAKG